MHVDEDDEPFFCELRRYQLAQERPSVEAHGRITLKRVSSLDTDPQVRAVLRGSDGARHYLVQAVPGRVRCYNESFDSLTTYCSPPETPPSPVKLELVQAFMALLVQRRGLLLHAAGVVLGESALLFVGPCGAGKSTAARLSRGRLLSDDLVTVTGATDRPIAHSTTFGGVTDGEAAAALGAIVFPQRASSFRLRRLPPLEAFLRFRSENWSYLCHVPPPLIPTLLDSVLGLLRSVPALEVAFPVDDFRVDELRQVVGA